MSINPEQIKNYIADLASPDEEIQCRAEDALIDARVTAVDALIDAMKDPNPQVRFRAVWALGKIGDSRAYPTIVELTHDPDSAVSYDAIMALGELGDARAVEPLIELVRRYDEDEVPAGAAGNALAKIGKPAVGPLIEVLQTGSNGAKSITARVLGGIGDKSTVEPLAKLLVDSDEQLRIAAIEALAELGEEHPLVVGFECLELIEERLSDPSTAVSDSAIYWNHVLRQTLGMPTSEDEEE